MVVLVRCDLVCEIVRKDHSDRTEIKRCFIEICNLAKHEIDVVLFNEKMQLLERGVLDGKKVLMGTIGPENPEEPEGNCICRLHFIKNKDTAATRVEYGLIMSNEYAKNLQMGIDKYVEEKLMPALDTMEAEINKP